VDGGHFLTDWLVVIDVRPSTNIEFSVQTWQISLIFPNLEHHCPPIITASALCAMSSPKELVSVHGASLPILSDDPSSWIGSSLLSVTQITNQGLQLLMTEAQHMRELVQRQGGDERLKHRVIGTVFFEASTRTACSFQAAALRLGGTFLHVDGQSGSNSSAGQKGETLSDTIQCLACYTDLTVLRHPVTGSVKDVIQTASKPVVNAGDGIDEHPTQALLDVYTIYDELKLGERALAPLTVVLLGDLKHGRTVHSLARLLCVTRHILWDECLTLRFCAPTGLDIPDSIRDYCASYDNVKVECVQDPNEACRGDANVLYVTRIQRERFDSDESYLRVKVRACASRAMALDAPKSLRRLAVFALAGILCG
jgi:aspartate carbamoyltransferase